MPQIPGCIKYLPRSLGFRRLGSSARISPAPLGREGFRAPSPSLSLWARAENSPERPRVQEAPSGSQRALALQEPVLLGGEAVFSSP